METQLPGHLTNRQAARGHTINSLPLEGLRIHPARTSHLSLLSSSDKLAWVSTKTREDHTHARQVRDFVESDQFFGGRYKGRVIEIHSKLTGEESDENARRLLDIERDGTTDIVVHVNKLKEGWDVSNLFTIVPLRASASDILTEQTLGRGLRLPYGKRTGVEAVDTLTVIAHDRFNALIEMAKSADGLVHKFKAVRIGDGGDVPSSKPVMVEAPSIIQTMIQQAAEPAPPSSSHGGLAAPPTPRFTFDKPEEIALAETALNVVLPSFQTRLASEGSTIRPVASACRPCPAKTV
ncbi:hypothetical protein [Phenylobacterium sp.]|uniref:hypothetical protein n=1 Tax=Phenylobacterium sp. TaxID=1871053 RepID=UPI004036C0B7